METTSQLRCALSLRSIAFALVAIGATGCEPEPTAKAAEQTKSAAVVAPPTKADDKPARAETPESPAAPSAAASPEAAPEATSDPGVLTIAKFGLEAKAPTGAEATDSPGDAVIVRAPELTLRLAKATDKHYATAKKAKRASAMYEPKDWTAKEVDGGYVATFKRSSAGMTSYWVRGYRTIDGTAYDCSTTVETEAEAANAAALCEALTSVSSP